MWATVVTVWRSDLPGGEVLEEFEIEHRLERFQEFFSRIEKHNPELFCGGSDGRLQRVCAAAIIPGQTLISTDLAGLPRVANHQIGRHEK
jgi:hypothetical protein